MFYTIYKTTNVNNGKIYIGKHVTDNLDDNYLGSGLALNRAIKKYGRDAFVKKVLYVFSNEQEMIDKEIELVNESFCKRDDTYNIALGGQGGKIVLFPEHPLYEEVKRKISLSRDREKLSELAKANHKERRIGMYGRKQSDKQKEAASKANRGKKKSAESIEKRKVSMKKTFSNPDYVHPNKGQARPHAVDLAKKLPYKECKYCSRIINVGNFARYHGEKCKMKDTNGI